MPEPAATGGNSLQLALEEEERIQRKASETPDGDQRNRVLAALAQTKLEAARELSRTGRHTEALGKTREAVEIYRSLAGERPAAFLPDLAASLNNLGTTLAELGRREEALEAAREAVEILTALAGRWPEVFGGRLDGATGLFKALLDTTTGDGEARRMLERAKEVLAAIGEG